MKKIKDADQRPDILSRAAGLLAAGETFCLATVIASGRPDAPPGLKAIVRSGGEPEELSLPPGLAPGLRDLALAAINEKESRTVEAEPGLSVFLDVISAEAGLLICGAGHIALPLARFALETGFNVTVLDDRPDFASAARFPGCAVIAESFIPALRAMPLGPSSYAVVITRGHEHDAECLAEILPRETAYTGLIGSRRRVAFVLAMLGEKGIPRKRLDEVFTPIGIPIGSESPGEIALSIAAELVCVRRLGARAARALRAAREVTND
ncbi:MAG: XdhC family protein [Elusimicrobia bacterium]|nr:XdhC family protein [Elusimicrobiota bacterium]